MAVQTKGFCKYCGRAFTRWQSGWIRRGIMTGRPIGVRNALRSSTKIRKKHGSFRSAILREWASADMEEARFIQISLNRIKNM